MQRTPRTKEERTIKYRPQGPNMALVDGLNAIFKVIFTLGTFSYKGQNTTIQYGITNILRTYIENRWPRGIIFVLDGKGSKKKRQEIYPEYKKNREGKNKDIDWDAIFEQIRELKNMLPYYGIGVADIEGYEADDVIAYLANYFNSMGKTVEVVSSDKDLYQLINSYNTVYSISNKSVVTLDNFLETTGVTMDRYLDYRCMVGDKSDNIVGIAGIGEKTAASLLEYSTLDEALHTPQRGRLAALNQDGAEDIILRNRKLMDLSNVAIDKSLIDSIILPERADKSKVKEMFADLGFFSFLDKYDEFITPFASLHTRGEYSESRD
jgi:DNA polymerase-1